MTFLKYLEDNLGMSSSEIQKFARTAPHRYKLYTIDKRNSNQKRLIAHPSKELKFVQRLLVAYFEEILPIHDSSHGYVKKKGIKTNALTHKNNNYLLKMDFSNFFPSITPDLLSEKLQLININFDYEDFELLKGLLFCKFNRLDILRLSIGAPSSPLISNFILYNFDTLISNHCHDKGVTFTRYADDLTFSTKQENVLFEMPEVVKALIRDTSGGRISTNDKKTIFSSKAHNRHVTGITLTNDGALSIGRDRKRLISSMIHKFIYAQLDEHDIQKLQGYFAFAVHIEPNFHERMCNKYGQDNIANLVKHQIAD